MESYYIGYYKNRVIAVSNKKKLISNYFESHRGLVKGEYEIKEEMISETTLMLHYEDKIITEYMGYYIPDVDSTIIQLFSGSIDMEIVETIDHLRRIAILANDVKKLYDIKKSQPDVASIVNTIKVLSKMAKSKKIMNKLNKRDIMVNSILFCNMEEYLQRLSQYEEMKHMRTSYEYSLYSGE